jgi:hypothetical protein
LWTPFAPLPMDDEPQVAALRQKRLRKLMATARFSAQPPEWQQVVKDEYQRMRQAVALAGQAAAMAQPAQRLASDLEKIRLSAALNPKAPAPGAGQVEAEAIQRDEGFIPKGGQPPQSPSPSPLPQPAG